MNYKNISYTISHIFVMLFMYLFIAHRYSKPKTVGICTASFFAITVPNVLKLNIFPDSSLCYFLVTVYQIAMTQLTGLFISKWRDSKALFVGLSGSNYVIAGSIMAAILHIYTGNLYLCITGCIVTHVVILFVLYTKIRGICLEYQGETMNSWWKLCLIPVFFFCGFSSLTFFPYTLDDHPHNILGVVMFIITMFVAYVVVMRYVSTESQRTDLCWQNMIFETYIKNLENQYYLVEQSEKNLRILRHDMRHYSGMIDSLLDQGEYQEIKKVIEHINTVADGNKVTKYCSNLIVNTMLSCMMEKALSLDVEVHQDIVVAEKIPVDSYEFAMVVANLLENAVDCVKEFTQHRKFVDVKIHCEADHLLIHMKNAYESDIIFDTQTGLPKSQKGKNHGFGMQSVQAFADKTGGNIGCYCEDGMFQIMLFAKF
ncbi:MAG: GHKL domain-containing protein [Lachnospiraceae bacterium]|nr:GHKL domain-containing protein [Lachnospiraceae bacterium]